VWTGKKYIMVTFVEKSNVSILFETKSCQAYCRPLKLIIVLVGFIRGFICIIKANVLGPKVNNYELLKMKNYAFLEKIGE